MPEPSLHPDGRMTHPEVRYERSDASFVWILGLILGAMAFAALVHYLVLVFFFDYRDYQSAIKKSPFPLAPGISDVLPRQPHLEPLDRLEKVERSNVYVREANREEVLNSYGLTNEEGFVHVPIQEAMKYLENKLPARAAPADRQRDSGLVDAGESNSGRLFHRRP
jgi:hypothetical protein